MDYNTIFNQIIDTLKNRGYSLGERLSNPHTTNISDVHRVLKEKEKEANYVVKITVLPYKYAVKYQETMNDITSLSHSHQNLITIIDEVEEPIPYEEDEYVVWMLMEGGPYNLEKMIENVKKVDPKEAIEVIKQTSNALDALYKMRYVHRDIKTSNIIVKKDKNGKNIYKLCDLNTMTGVDEEGAGLASVYSAYVAGTKHYLAPELNIDNEVGNVDRPPRDIYSLGIVLYQLLTGTSQGGLLRVNSTKDKPVKLAPEEYRRLQRSPKEFYEYLGLETNIPDEQFLFREVIKNLLFYNPIKQGEWGKLPENDSRKLSGPDTPWNGRIQDYDELASHIKIFDNFDLMEAIEENLAEGIEKGPVQLLTNLGAKYSEKGKWELDPEKGIWNKMIRLRG